MATHEADKTKSPVRVYSTDAVIPINTAVSAAVDTRGMLITSVIMSAAWTAAAMTFSVSDDGVTYYDLFNLGAEVNIAVLAAQAVVLDPAVFASWRFVIFRSGTSAVPVNQLAARTLKLQTRVA